jgi:hypothetical protein
MENKGESESVVLPAKGRNVIGGMDLGAKSRNLAGCKTPFRSSCASLRILFSTLLLSHTLHSPFAAMKTLSFLLGLLALAVSGVYGTALTYKLAANEKACFFTNVQRQGAKVAFYFAVRLRLDPYPVVWVQSLMRN